MISNVQVMRYIGEFNKIVYLIALVEWVVVSLLVLVYATRFVGKFSVVANIIMLRDFKLFYRAIKMMNRPTDDQLNSSFVVDSMRPIHKQQLQTLFDKLGETKETDQDILRRIPISSVRDLGYMLGQSLQIDEWVNITKETVESIDETEEDYIDFTKFVSYVEKINEETKIDPFVIIQQTIKNYKLCNNDGIMHFKDLK